MPVETPVTTDRACLRCGTPLPEGTYWCPSCGKLNASPAARLIFVLIIAGILAGIVFTGWYVGYLRNLQSSLANRWFARGEEAMAKNYPDLAVEYYRNALGYDGNNPQYRLKLAEALEADGHLKEAGSYLLGLWSQEPANAQVNLDLARLYARQHKTANAVRYYRAAIDGVWNANALQQRLAARLELVHYLLALGNKNNAVAELIALQSEAPPEDASQQMQIADLFMQLGEYSRALHIYEAMVKEHPDLAEGWSGAGRAALALGDYHKAEQLLTTAVNLNSSKTGNPDAETLSLAREVMTIDPNLRTLKLSERAKRAAVAFEYAMNRLTTCAGRAGMVLMPTATAAPAAVRGQSPQAASAPAALAPNSLQLLYDSGLERRSSATAAALRENPDAIVPTMEFVYQVTRATEGSCPANSPEQQALQVLAHHDLQEQR